jgi:chromosomal replication initiator protein
VVRPRQIAMYLSKVLTLRSLPRSAAASEAAITHGAARGPPKSKQASGEDNALQAEVEL